VGVTTSGATPFTVLYSWIAVSTSVASDSHATTALCLAIAPMFPVVVSVVAPGTVPDVCAGAFPPSEEIVMAADIPRMTTTNKSPIRLKPNPRLIPLAPRLPDMSPLSERIRRFRYCSALNIGSFSSETYGSRHKSDQTLTQCSPNSTSEVPNVGATRAVAAEPGVGRLLRPQGSEMSLEGRVACVLGRRA
jgi:hypothetical protein